MTQDVIIEMARQAGGIDLSTVHGGGVRVWLGTDRTEFLERLTKLVAAKEREACAKVADELPAPDIYNDTDKSMWDVTCMDCATAIRARGQA
jgi:hypothetical protein